MKEAILLKCGELVLKGLNRNKFEDKMLKDLRERLAVCGAYRVYTKQSIVYVEPSDESSDMDEAYRVSLRTFGANTVCRCAVCEKSMESVAETAAEYLKKELSLARTFKVDAKRADKSFPFKSPEIMRETGGAILEKYPHLRVQLDDPDVTVYVEIRESCAYLHAAPERGPGGMPAGSNGKACTLISGGIDSPVATYLMARRGLEICAVHFFSYPYTSDEALEKVKTLLRILEQSAGKIRFFVVPFTEIQESIRDNCPEDLFTVLMRRFMMKISCRIAAREGCGALITGESLGQVASQTLDALRMTDSVCDMPVFRPLIGLDKRDIVDIARKIGTFETSILPYEDCCTVFTPKHPETKPKPWQLEKAEALLDTDSLIKNAIEGTYDAWKEN